jgi:hypothetical protein
MQLIQPTKFSKKLSTIFFLGLLIGALFFGGYSVYSAIQSEVGVNHYDHVGRAWNRSCRSVFTNLDGTDRTNFTGCGIQDADAMLWLSTGGNTVNRARDGTSAGDAQTIGLIGTVPMTLRGAAFDRLRSPEVDGSAIIGFPGAANLAFNSATWDRIRTASGDTLAATGILGTGPLTFNGTTFDRTRSSGAATTTTGTGIPASGPLVFASDSNYYRLRGSALGDQYVNSFPRQTGVTNSETTSAANTAVSITLTAGATDQAFLFKVTARCSAGTSSLTVTNGVAQIWSTSAAAVTTVNFTETWQPGLTSTIGNDPVITLAACGAGNTGTLSVQASVSSA